MNVVHKIGKVFIIIGLLLFTLGSFDGQFYINKKVLDNCHGGKGAYEVRTMFDNGFDGSMREQIQYK